MIISTVATQDNKAKQNEYPKLMLNPVYNFIVLLTAPRTGMILNAGTSDWYVGYSSSGWIQEELTPYIGIVSLSNAS